MVIKEIILLSSMLVLNYSLVWVIFNIFFNMSSKVNIKLRVKY